MKISGRFLVSSPISYGSSGQCNFPFLSSFHFRCFGAKAVANCDSREQIQSIKGLGDALKMFDKMSRMRPLPSVVQFTQLLSRVVNLKEYSAAICLFKDICDLGMSVDEYTMNIAINCYCLSNRVDFGFSILGSFFKRGCVPDVFTFSTLLKGLFRENKVNEAQELFRKMVKEDLCELSVVTYGTVIDGLCKAGNTPMAIEMLRVMEKGRSSCKPNTHVYTMVIDSLCKDRMIDSALKLFDEMSGKGITPDFYTYGNVLDGLCRNGQVERAVMLLDALEHKKGEIHLHISYYNIVMDGFCKAKKLDAARAIFKDLAAKGLEPDVVTYNIMIKGFCENGLLMEAKDLVLRMEHDAGLLPNEVTYNSIIQGNLKWGKYEDAEKLIEQMCAKGFSLNAFV